MEGLGEILIGIAFGWLGFRLWGWRESIPKARDAQDATSFFASTQGRISLGVGTFMCLLIAGGVIVEGVGRL